MQDSTIVIVCSLAYLIKRFLRFNAFKTLPLDWLQKQRREITSHLFLGKLHWLTIDKRIVFKGLIITYKALHGLSPKYIPDLLTLKRSSRILRSNYQDSLRLETPTFKTKNYGGKAFSVCAPRLWNDLPRDLRNSPSLETFKRGLKIWVDTNFASIYSLGN